MTIVLALPGTGFDAAFAAECFSPFAHELGATLASTTPEATNHIASLNNSISHYLSEDEVIIAGLSISSAVAVNYTKLNRDYRIKGIIAAIPAWTAGSEEPMAPARFMARQTANQVRQRGIEHTIAQMKATSPAWMAAHLERSWRNFGPGLAQLCTETVNYNAPTAEDLSALSIPLVCIGVEDDPIHPVHVAQTWAGLAPRSYYGTTSMADIAASLSHFSAVALQGWRTI